MSLFPISILRRTLPSRTFVSSTKQLSFYSAFFNSLKVFFFCRHLLLKQNVQDMCGLEDNYAGDVKSFIIFKQIAKYLFKTS